MTTYLPSRARRGEEAGLLTTQEAADALRLSTSRVRTLRARGELRGPRGFVTAESVREYARQRGERVVGWGERLNGRQEQLLQRVEELRAARDARVAAQAAEGPFDVAEDQSRGLDADQDAEEVPSSLVDGVRPRDNQSQAGGADA